MDWCAPCILVDSSPSLLLLLLRLAQMWNRLGEMEDTKCLIPERCYATMYQEMISYLKSNNQFDVATMGNVVGTAFDIER